MNTIQQQTGNKELREFGLTFGVFVVLIFGLFFPWIFGKPIILNHWPWWLAVVFMVTALVFPAALKWPYRGWMKFGHIMGWINTRLILGFLFFGIFLPIGAVIRLFGWDAMQRKLNSDQKTYRLPSQQPEPQHLKRPF